MPAVSLRPPPFRTAPDAVRLDAVAVARGGVAVLSGITAEIARGRALILRGPNGSGKTTLLRTIAGLQPPVAGRIAPDPDHMAYASHADGLKATLTVAENLRFWAEIHGHRDIAPALAAFYLGSLARRPAAALSAGQKRRLGLARMMVTQRPVWLLDEPTVSLDSGAVALFAAAVRAHLDAGGIAVIATHIDLGLDEALVLDVAPFRPVAAPPRDGPSAVSAFDDDDDAEAFL